LEPELELVLLVLQLLEEPGELQVRQAVLQVRQALLLVQPHHH
jgi:hypothetical protein